MSYLGATSEGIAEVEAGAAALTGIVAMKNTLMVAVVIADGMMTGMTAEAEGTRL